MYTIKKITKAEKTINNKLLTFIIGEVFLLNFKEKIGDFLRKHAKGIKKHLEQEYKKWEIRYLTFKKKE